MNKKGFTLVELLITFSLISVICVLVFEIVLKVQNIYITGDVKTTLLTKQGNLLKRIHDDLDKRELASITSCGSNCLQFVFQNGNISKLNIQDQTVLYNNYSVTFPKNVTFEEKRIEIQKVASLGENNTILKVEMPITSKQVKGDFGISFIYQYNDTKVTVDPSILK